MEKTNWLALLSVVDIWEQISKTNPKQNFERYHSRFGDYVQSLRDLHDVYTPGHVHIGVHHNKSNETFNTKTYNEALSPLPLQAVLVSPLQRKIGRP